MYISYMNFVEAMGSDRDEEPWWNQQLWIWKVGYRAFSISLKYGYVVSNWKILARDCSARESLEALDVLQVKVFEIQHHSGTGLHRFEIKGQ